MKYATVLLASEYIIPRELPDSSSFAIRELRGNPDFLVRDVFRGWEPIHVAAHEGNTESISGIIENGIYPNCQTNMGMTPLCIGAENEHPDTMRYLLNSGAQIGKSNFNGLTPLSEASAQGKVNAVKVLLEAGANPKGTDNNDGFLLRVASSLGHLEVVKLLIDYECVIDIPEDGGRTAAVRTIISWSFNENDVNLRECIIQFLDAGSDLEHLSMSLIGRTSLFHTAVKVGNLTVVEFLIETKVNLNSTDEDGNTPLHVAIESSILSIAQKLLSAGVDTTIRNKVGRTAIEESKTQFESGSVNYLLESNGLK